MTDRVEPTVPKWPFLLGDALFIALAVAIVAWGAQPFTMWQVCALIICVGAGAWLCVLPFLWEHEAAVKLAQADKLLTTAAQIQNMEAVASQITSATSQWQSALDQSAKTVASADEIATRMTEEAKAFAEFMQRANDTEKTHLRLEADKLRRGEGDWMTVLTRILDHVFALHQAALRSGQQNLIQQIGGFQLACRDAARRIGLSPLVPAENDAFDSKAHQLTDEAVTVPTDAIVAETLATGYTFQGQLVRRAVVVLKTPETVASVEPTSVEPASGPAEPQLL
jgi:molecular chaperone GrpE (heat shock protein)